jgi:septal ring factor EnvC (AmiA/AmiB activator)
MDFAEKLIAELKAKPQAPVRATPLAEMLRTIAGQDTTPPLWIYVTKEQIPALTAAADRIDQLEHALRQARKHLQKGRALWNGPCHQTAYVLDEAIGKV